MSSSDKMLFRKARNLILPPWLGLGIFIWVAPLVLLGAVETGLDRLIAENFQRLNGRTVAILTHQSAVDALGRHLLKTLPGKHPFRIKALLAPEHGFYGQLDAENISNALEPETGLTIYSLYGKTRKPTAAMLAEIDLLIIDLQDIGTRFYTYQTTLLYTLEVCADLGVDVLLLDRPNPMGGQLVAGPLLQPEHFSFTGAFRMPVIHGMTMGEMAKMFAAERQLKLNLDVLACKNWRRHQRFGDTGLVWVNPSPNMRRPRQVLLYPAIGMLEYSNLSVGRGTDTPFEILGAPWIKPVDFARQLTESGLPGVAFIPRFFTPKSGPYAGETCGGVVIDLQNVQSFQPIETAFTIFQILIKSYPKNYQPEKVIKLLGHAAVFKALLRGASLQEVASVSQADLDAFLRLRRQYLLY